MKATRLAIPDVFLVEPKVFGDERGFFFESFNHAKFEKAIGKEVSFVQDNHSKSLRGVIRGIHYQDPKPQGKLIRVSQGEVFDVVVDIRKGSPTFGSWVAEILSAENKKQIWIPAGLAHGFLVISESAEVLYKTTEYYEQKFEHTIIWNDTDLGIQWPLKGLPKLSLKDQHGKRFCELFSGNA